MPRISALSAAPNANGAELAAARAGSSVKVTPAQIAAAALTATVPAAVGSVGAAGASSEPARVDHVHAHGDQGGGTQHAAAVPGGDSGFMTGAQASKLAGIATGADVTNATTVAASGAVMDTDFTGSFVAELIRTAAGTYAPVKMNRAATTAPTANDDSTQDYSVGSRWIDTTADRVYVCVDATAAAAVWREISVVTAAVAAAGAVMVSAYTPAHSLLVQQTGTGSPSSLSVGVSTLLGRSAGGGSPIAALAAADARAILAYPADEVSYDNATSGLTADNVQDAIDEIAGLGGGGGGGGDPRFYEVTGFVTDSATPANGRGYTLGAADPTTANGQMTVCVIARPGTTQYNPAPRFVFGTCERSGGSFTAGWGIIWDQGWRLVYVDNAGTPHVTSQYAPETVNRFAILHLRVSNFGIGADLGVGLFANGYLVGEFYGGTDGGAPTAGSNLCLGAPDDGAHDASQLLAFDGHIHGAGYVNSTFMTETQIAQHVIACQEAGQLVDPASGAFTDAWRADASTGLTMASFKSGTDLDALNTTALTSVQKPLPIIYF